MGEAITVVGGSVTGFFTAGLLARAGREVTLLERSRELAPARRTLIVTHRFSELVGPVGDECVTNEISRFELFADGRVANIDLEVPDLIIERARLIRDLADQAANEGASIEFGRRFIDMLPSRDGPLLTTRNGSGPQGHSQVATVIGADGAQSRVARMAGWRPQPMVSLIQAIVKLPQGMSSDTTRVWFRPDVTSYFYWLVPDSEGRGALGLIGEEPARARRALDEFLREQALEPLEYQAAVIPAYKKWTRIHRRVNGGDVYLVGDAAGQVKVSTVGGIVTGLRGALGVVETILDGRGSRQLRSLRRELDLHLMIRKGLHGLGQDDYNYVLDKLDTRARGILSGHSRDEAGRILLKLLRHRPQLLLRGIRGLLVGGNGFAR